MKNQDSNPPEVPPPRRGAKKLSVVREAVKGNWRFRAARQNPENKRPQYTARRGTQKNSHQKPIERYTLYLLKRSLLKQCSQEGRQKPIERYTLYLLNRSLLKHCFQESRQKPIERYTLYLLNHNLLKECSQEGLQQPIERYTLYFVEIAVKGNCRF